jgi:hypothetical protein
VEIAASGRGCRGVRVCGRRRGQHAAHPPIDVKSLHAKIGELTLENDFLEVALGKAGLLSARRPGSVTAPPATAFLDAIRAIGDLSVRYCACRRPPAQRFSALAQLRPARPRWGGLSTGVKLPPRPAGRSTTPCRHWSATALIRPAPLNSARPSPGDLGTPHGSRVWQLASGLSGRHQ